MTCNNHTEMHGNTCKASRFTSILQIFAHGNTNIKIKFACVFPCTKICKIDVKRVFPCISVYLHAFFTGYYKSFFL